MSVLGVDINGRDMPLEVINTGFNGAVTAPTVVPTISPTPITPTATLIPPTVVPGSLSVISGVVNIPGGTDHSGITVGLYTGANPLVEVMTTASGRYQFVDVPVGAYNLRISNPQSLTLEQPIVIDATGLSIDNGTDLMPVGDTDDNGIIDVNDASLVGINYEVAGSLVANADLNRDALIDIRDLVLVGRNFGLVSPVTPE